MKGLIQKNPPIDLGVGIHDNFRIYKLSLIFIDLLINLKEKSICLGIGIPFLYTLVFYYIKNNKT
jgi:hypothetical protein